MKISKFLFISAVTFSASVVGFARADQSATCVPPAQWTQAEQKFVQEARQTYTSKGFAFDDQQACEAVGAMRARMAALMGSVGALQMLANPANAQALQHALPLPQVAQQTPTMGGANPAQGASTEASLGAKIAALPHSQGGVQFERLRDGFTVNGQRYVDPEGRIVTFGFDSKSADFTDVVQVSPTDFVIKFGRALPGVTPIKIAQASKIGNEWSITTVAGERLTGQNIIPVSRGFVVTRDDVGFLYKPGEGIKNITPPQGYTIAWFQNGDIGSTGYILLARIPNYNPSGSGLGSLIGSFKAMGADLGLTKKDDFALMRISDGHMVQINVPLEGQEVLVMSNCRKKNAAINICNNATSYNSLYDQNGFKNSGHYFWRIYWFESNGRPISVTEEEGVTNIYLTDLDTGRRVVLFHRALGITDFSVQQDPDGVVNVDAKWMFSNHRAENVATLLDRTPAVAASGVVAEGAAASSPLTAASAPIVGASGVK
jgi:hypothetical protein